MDGDRIFVAADARPMRDVLASILREDAARYLVVARGTTRGCLLEFRGFRPHVVVADMGPITERRRVGLLKKLQRSPAGRLPGVLIILGGRRVSDVEPLLELGADGVVLQEELSADGLRARVRLVLRRIHADRGSHLSHGPLKLCLANRRVEFGAVSIVLRGDSFRMLRRLLAAQGEAVAYHDLLDYRAGVPREKARRAAKSRIYRLRHRLGPAGAHIESVPGVGYRVRP